MQPVKPEEWEFHRQTVSFLGFITCPGIIQRLVLLQTRLLPLIVNSNGLLETKALWLSIFTVSLPREPGFVGTPKPTRLSRLLNTGSPSAPVLVGSQAPLSVLMFQMREWGRFYNDVLSLSESCLRVRGTMTRATRRCWLTPGRKLKALVNTHKAAGMVVHC